MNVVEVELINFTAHKKTLFKLPKTGVFLITGENGAGKSSIIEGVSFAGWGKTLRGTVPWRADAKPACTARLVTDRLNITRSREGKKGELSWEDWEAAAQDFPGASSDDPEYDTPTKADAALQVLMGPFDLWRRSHVFSSADAKHFTTATDRERKALIESFLGNDRFDPALEACRSDLKKAREQLSELERKREVAETKLAGAKQLIASTKQREREMVEPPAVPQVEDGPALKEFDDKLSEHRRSIGELRVALRKADSAGGGHESVMRQCEALLAKLKADRCPTCTQPIDPKFRKKIAAEAVEAKEAASKAKEAASAARADVEEAMAQTDAAIQHLQKERDARSRELAVVQHAKQERVRYDTALKSLKASITEAEQEASKLKTKLVDLEEELDLLAQDVDELEAVEVVLGVKGVRAHILGKSLGGIEAIANVWLARLYAKPVSVSLKPYSELKKGGFDDSISFEVDGVGENLGYKATSGGERRRLDVAMLLAMAEVAAAARGMQAGTLWVDEVFDCLDDGGVEAVCAALRELAKDRCVVVITHSKFLIQNLPDAERVHIVAGQIAV